MFYAGEFHDSENGEVTEIRNPSTGEVVDTVAKGTAGDVRKAVEAAEGAFGVWSRMAPAKRGALLQEAVRLVRENEKELTSLLTREQGKPIRESILEIRRFGNITQAWPSACAVGMSPWTTAVMVSL
jgi:succinate-semialdehyde dehydrogenase/glutarate-semialdehyde dehydrogenase